MENYLNDLLEELLEQVTELKNEGIDNEFNRGKLFAYYEIMAKILNKAEAFNLKELPKKWAEYDVESILNSSK